MMMFTIKCAVIAGLLILCAWIFWQCGAANAQRSQDTRATPSVVGLRRIRRGATWCFSHGLHSLRDAVCRRGMSLAYKEDVHGNYHLVEKTSGEDEGHKKWAEGLIQ